MSEQLLIHNGKILKFNEDRLVWTTSAAPAIPTDYIAFFKMDGDMTDETGNWTCSNSNITFTTGKFGQCAVFNGSSSVGTTNIPHNRYNANTFAYTSSIWINFTSTSRGKVWMNSDGGGDLGHTGVNDSAGRINGSRNSYFATSAAFNDGNWHHVVTRYDGGGASAVFDFWVDGVQINSGTDNATLANRSTFSTFGRHGSYNGVYYNGKAEYARLYDRALTDAEIIALYNE